MKYRLFLPICFGALMLVLTAFGAMDMLGYKLIEGAVQYFLLGVLIVMALVTLGAWLTRKAKKGAARVLTGGICTVVVVLASALMITFFIFVNSFYVPQNYAVLESNDGRKIAVMRSFSQDFAMERCRDRGGDTVNYADLGYKYQIYPVFSKFFYNSKSAGEGTLEIGCSSSAVLKHDWDGGALHLYIENPEKYDSGELILR